MLVDVDRGPEFWVKTATRHVVMVRPGLHEVRVRASGFAPTVTTVDLTRQERAIVAITPAYLESVSRSTPLGLLRAHVVNGPEELHPYRFYRSWPPRKGSVLPALFLSAMGSAIVAGLGAAAVVVALYILVRHVLVGLFLLACLSVVVPMLVWGGVGGMIMAVRFLRLSPDWRAPGKMAPWTPTASQQPFQGTSGEGQRGRVAEGPLADR